MDLSCGEPGGWGLETGFLTFLDLGQQLES